MKSRVFPLNRVVGFFCRLGVKWSTSQWIHTPGGNMMRSESQYVQTGE